MYDLYVEYARDKNQEPEKESYYRCVFNTHFNLRFKKPLTDTCSVCDKLENKINHSTDQDVIRKSNTEKELHLRKAEKARYAKNEAKRVSKDNPEIVKAITFDLQNTLPTPMLTCSTVYYLRQLWTYNFGIHDLGTGKGTMFMWSEGQAHRGSQEIGSCLLKYCQGLPSTIKKLKAFSDNAGGQNKNKNIVKFWMYIICNTHIEEVDHMFLETGHSIMECDQDFGVIEKAKKNAQVFVPDDWENVVKQSSKKFSVVKMARDNFKSIDSVNTLLNNSKNIKGMREIRWLHFEKKIH